MTDASKPLYLVDASIYIFQSHFSPYVECYDRDGAELGALYGFAQFLLQFLRRMQPRHLAAAHDASLFSGFRHELCDAYKSNRELPDENLEMQLAACFEVCAILGVPSFTSSVYEADDIIGTLAQRARTADRRAQVHIVSKDKDLAQLLRHERDCLWDFVANRKRYRRDIIDEFGVTPEQFPDYLGLIGDSVDCIKGVPGIGPVKARELLARFETLEGIYANLGQLSQLPLRGAGRLSDLLREHRELADLSKTLATIVCEVDDTDEQFCRADMDALQVGRPDMGALQDFLARYKFSERESRRLSGMCQQLLAT